MSKLYSILLSILLTFNMSGCTVPEDIELQQSQQVVSDIENKSVDVVDASTQMPSSPREDLEVEVVPGIKSTYGLMRVHFMDVGQADSAFIELGNGQTMLIDAGRGGDANSIINYIRELQYFKTAHVC